MLGLWESTFEPEKDIPDLAGKVFLVTGGNVGLGKETVLQLAKHNPKNIFLAARDRTKGEDAIADINKTVPGAKITFLSLDLTSLKSVKAAAETVLASTIRLDALINNAGIMAVPPGLTQDGYEIQFGTNHMGHYLLTRLLLPLLKKMAASSPDADVRIVSLSSEAHVHPPSGGIRFDTLDTKMESYNTFVRYGQSKLANILHSHELAKRNPEIRCIAVHPGGVNTNLSRTFADNHPWIATVASPLQWFIKTPAQGALTQLWAATSKDAQTGKYYVPTAKEHPGSANSRNVELAGKLWEWSEGEMTRHGYS